MTCDIVTSDFVFQGNTRYNHLSAGYMARPDPPSVISVPLFIVIIPLVIGTIGPVVGTLGLQFKVALAPLLVVQQLCLFHRQPECRIAIFL